jgi:hypothetical protein
MQLELTKDQKKYIENDIKTKYNWESKEYEIKLLAEWDNSKVPIFTANQKERKIEFAPKYALLPNGKFITPWEKDALTTLLRLGYPNPEPKDVKFIAELAIMFGDFKEKNLHLWLNPVQDRISKKNLKRKDPNPILSKDGTNITIEFYAYNYDLMQFFDCSIKITPKEILLLAKNIK